MLVFNNRYHMYEAKIKSLIPLICQVFDDHKGGLTTFVNFWFWKYIIGALLCPYSLACGIPLNKVLLIQ